MTISVKLDKNAEDRLHYLAKQTGRTMSFYIREAIDSELDDLEDIYLTEKTVEDIRSGKSTTTSWKDIKRQNHL